MGCVSSVPDAGRYCHTPSSIDDARFDPLCNSYPTQAASSVSPQSTAHFSLKCSLAVLHQSFRRETFRDPAGDDLSYDLARAFAAKVNTWRDSIPEDYKITFGERMGDSQFPSGDIQALQAADLHVEVNLLIMKLWHPFLQAAFDGKPCPNRQAIELAVVTAANQIIILSQHAIGRFGPLLPVSFGYYGFGRAVFLAGTLLGTVYIHAPDIIFRTLVRDGLDHSMTIVKHHLVAGKPSTSNARTKYELQLVLSELQKAVSRSSTSRQAPTGAKRKADDRTDRITMRPGFQIPFLGTTAVTASGELDVRYGASQGFNDPTGQPLPGLEDRIQHRGGERSIHPMPKGRRKNGSMESGGGGLTSEESDVSTKKGPKPKPSRSSSQIRESPGKPQPVPAPTPSVRRPSTKISGRIAGAARGVGAGDGSQESTNEHSDHPSQSKKHKNNPRRVPSLPGPMGPGPSSRSSAASPTFDATVGGSSSQPRIQANPAPQPVYSTTGMVPGYMFEQPQQREYFSDSAPAGYFSGSEAGHMQGLSLVDNESTGYNSDAMPTNSTGRTYETYSNTQPLIFQDTVPTSYYPQPNYANPTQYPPSQNTTPNPNSYAPPPQVHSPFPQAHSPYGGQNTPTQSPFPGQSPTVPYPPSSHPQQQQFQAPGHFLPPGPPGSQAPVPPTGVRYENYDSSSEWVDQSSVYGTSIG